jgi:hypothetical protein
MSGVLISAPRVSALHTSAQAGPSTFAFKPRRQPLLWAALAYSLGIVAGVADIVLDRRRTRVHCGGCLLCTAAR